MSALVFLSAVAVLALSLPAGAQSGTKDSEQPAVVSAVAPGYPGIARAKRAKGEVVVEVKIDAQGKVSSETTVSGHELLRASSESAAAAWRFAPAGATAAVRTARLTFAYSHSEEQDPARPHGEPKAVFMPPYRVEVILHAYTIN